MKVAKGRRRSKGRTLALDDGETLVGDLDVEKALLQTATTRLVSCETTRRPRRRERRTSSGIVVDWSFCVGATSGSLPCWRSLPPSLGSSTCSRPPSCSPPLRALCDGRTPHPKSETRPCMPPIDLCAPSSSGCSCACDDDKGSSAAPSGCPRLSQSRLGFFLPPLSLWWWRWPSCPGPAAGSGKSGMSMAANVPGCGGCLAAASRASSWTAGVKAPMSALRPTSSGRMSDRSVPVVRARVMSVWPPRK